MTNIDFFVDVIFSKPVSQSKINCHVIKSGLLHNKTIFPKKIYINYLNPLHFYMEKFAFDCAMYLLITRQHLIIQLFNIPCLPVNMHVKCCSWYYIFTVTITIWTLTLATKAAFSLAYRISILGQLLRNRYHFYTGSWDKINIATDFGYTNTWL